MLHKQKGYTPPILHKFTLLNLINEKYFHILSQQKYINSPIFNNVSRLNHYYRMNNTLQTKVKSFSHNLLKVQKHPRKKNDTAFFLDHGLSSN